MQCLCASAMMCVSSVCDAVSLCVCCDVNVMKSVMRCLCVWSAMMRVSSVKHCLYVATMMCVSSVCDAMLLCICCDVCDLSVWCSVSAYDLLWCVCHQSVKQSLCMYCDVCIISLWRSVAVYLLSCVCHQCGMVSLHMIYVDVCIISLWCSIAVYFLRCVCHQSVVRCLWHPKLNQMVLGCGDGRVHLYYDPKKSHRSVGSVVWLQLRQSEIFKCSTQEYWFYSQQSWATAVSEVWRWFADDGDLSIYYWRLKWCFVFCFVKCCLKLPSWSGTGMSKFQGQLFIMF